jgi:hypothetical protein
MALDDVSGEPDTLVPLTLAQQARLAQRGWAPAYARAHRARRSVAWLAAACLSGYVSFFLFQADSYDGTAGRATGARKDFIRAV